MTLKKIVLADADIIIHLVKLNFLNLLADLSDFYKWEILITEGILGECKDPVTSSLVNSMLRTGKLKIHLEPSFEAAKIIEELNKIMFPGKEIELFAVAKFREYDILTHDLENSKVYFEHYPLDRGNFHVYDLYHIDLPPKKWTVS